MYRDIITSSFQYISSITTSRFVYGGSYGLWLWGIDLGREPHDLDIKFLDLSVEERKALTLDFTPTIDKLPNISTDLEWKELEYEGLKLLVFTPESIVAAKKYTLDFLKRPKIIMSDRRLHHKEKVERDLAWLKEKYGLE